MTDYSAHVTLHACPPDQVRAVLAVFEEHYVDVTDGESPDRADGTPGPDRLALGVDYTNAWHGASHAEDIASALAAISGVAFTVAENAGDEAPGDYYRHTPALGTHHHPCDGECAPYVYLDKLREAIDSYDPAALRTLTGAAWAEEIAALGKASVGREEVVGPRVYEAYWDRRAGEVLVIGAAADDPDADLALSVDALRTLGPDGDADLLGVANGLRAHGWDATGEGWTTTDGRRIHWSAEVYRVDDPALTPRAPAAG